MTENMMYWITRLDSIHSMITDFICLSVLTGIVSLIGMCVSFCMREQNEQYNSEDHPDRDWVIANKFFTKLRTCLICASISFVFLEISHTFIPHTKEMAAIKVVPALVTPETAENIKSISKDVFEVTAKWLEGVKPEINKTREKTKEKKDAKIEKVDHSK